MKAFALITLSLLATAAPAAPMTAQQRAAEMSDTLQQYYPSRARAAGEQGMVGFSIRLDRQGDPTACEVTHSSGFRALDDETCAVVLAHGVFKQELNANGSPKTAEHEGVIVWRLAGAPAATLAAPIAVTASSDMDKMICKKALRMGTLASYERTCLTRRQWATQSDQMKERWYRQTDEHSQFGN